MSDRRSAYLTLVLGMVAFGGTWPAGKLASEHVPPAVIAVVRFATAASLLWLWARLSGRPVVRPRRADLPLVFLLGFTVVFAYNLCFLYGVRHSSAADGSVLVPGLIPVATALLAWSLRGMRPTGRAALGLAVALVGLVIVARPTGDVGSDRLLGDVLFLGAALCWSAYTIAGRRAIARYGSIGANVHATAAGTLLLLPVSFLDGGWAPLVHAPASALAGVAYLATVGTVLGFVAFYEGVRLIGAARAASFALLVPIFGVLSSVLVLGESLRATLAVGGAIVIGGLWLAESPSRHALPTAQLEAGS